MTNTLFTEQKTKETSQAEKMSLALLNMLEDIKAEKEKIERNRLATLNMLEDIDQSRKELKRLYEELKKLDVMKSDFTNIAGHELKTPLTPMKGFLSMMKNNPEKYGLNEKGKEYVDTCLRNTKRLDRLVSDILDISKLESGAMKFNIEDIDIIKLINNVVHDFKAAAAAAAAAFGETVILKADIPKTLPTVYGDSDRLTQVLTDLVNNAIKFTDKGSITIEAKVVDKNIQVSIKDTGMGIKKEDMSKLFTKFFQAQDITTRKTKGTGLGLAIAKEIIKAHNGEIWAESKGLGKGCTFSFTLPLKDHQKPKPISKEQKVKQIKEEAEKLMEEQV